jgi:hypothetical protein
MFIHCFATVVKHQSIIRLEVITKEKNVPYCTNIKGDFHS